MREKVIKYKLSICMMVKDEELNLLRCLKSIQSLLNKDDVELIIVDTGSMDNTVEIAKRFTENIYFHPWNNDFSGMRNITISYAKGEWIWILDADEEMVDEKQLVELLESPILSKYNTIQLLVRNYIYKNKSRFSVSPSLRIFRNENSFRYSGTVHNQPHFKPPVLKTNIYLNHYGYLNDDRALMNKKFKRTSTLLKNEINKNPKNIYYQFQLAKSYQMHGNYLEALEQIRYTYKIMKNINESIKYQYVFATYAILSLFNKCYEEGIRIAKEGLQYNKEYIDLYLILGKCQVNIGDYNNAINSLKNYLNLFELGENLSCFNDPALEILFYNQDSRNSALYDLAFSLMKENNYKEAEYYFNEMSDGLLKSDLAITLFLNKDQFYKIFNYYRNIENNDVRSSFEINLEEQKILFDDSKKQEIESIFAEAETSYGLLNKIRIVQEKQEVIKLIKKFFNSYNMLELPEFYYEVIEKALIYGYPIIYEFKKMSSHIIKKSVQYLLDKNDHNFKLICDLLEKNRVRKNDIETSRVYCSIANVVLLTEQEQAKNEEREISLKYHDIFFRYIQIGKNYTSLLYQTERLHLYYKSLENNEHKLFLSILFAEDSIEKGNIKGALRYYKEAVNIYPSFVNYLESFLVKIYIKVAKYFTLQNKISEAIEMYEEALLRSEDVNEQQKIINEIQSIKTSIE